MGEGRGMNMVTKREWDRYWWISEVYNGNGATADEFAIAVRFYASQATGRLYKV